MVLFVVSRMSNLSNKKNGKETNTEAEQITNNKRSKNDFEQQMPQQVAEANYMNGYPELLGTYTSTETTANVPIKPNYYYHNKNLENNKYFINVG